MEVEPLFLSLSDSLIIITPWSPSTVINHSTVSHAWFPLQQCPQDIHRHRTQTRQANKLAGGYVFVPNSPAFDSKVTHW